MSATFRNRVTELLGVDIPIVQAPMGWIALASAAQAVADAHDPTGPDRLTAVPTVLRSGEAFNVVPSGGELFVVLTRRTWELRSHSGEVSFPGGRQDDGDEHLWHTALREAHEEIGLDPTAVERIGELDHLATVTSRSFIVPYVGALDARPSTAANPQEVSAVLHVPVAELLDPTIFREERWTFPWAEDRPIFFFELVGDTVWGATGAMLRQLLGLVTGTVTRGQLDHI